MDSRIRFCKKKLYINNQCYSINNLNENEVNKFIDKIINSKNNKVIKGKNNNNNNNKNNKNNKNKNKNKNKSDEQTYLDLYYNKDLISNKHTKDWIVEKIYESLRGSGQKYNKSDNSINHLWKRITHEHIYASEKDDYVTHDDFVRFYDFSMWDWNNTIKDILDSINKDLHKNDKLNKHEFKLFIKKVYDYHGNDALHKIRKQIGYQKTISNENPNYLKRGNKYSLDKLLLKRRQQDRDFQLSMYMKNIIIKGNTNFTISNITFYGENGEKLNIPNINTNGSFNINQPMEINLEENYLISKIKIEGSSSNQLEIQTHESDESVSKGDFTMNYSFNLINSFDFTIEKWHQKLRDDMTDKPIIDQKDHIKEKNREIKN